MSQKEESRQADYFKNSFPPPELSQSTSVDAEWRILEEIIIIFLVRAFAAFEPPCNREIHIILTGPL